MRTQMIVHHRPITLIYVNMSMWKNGEISGSTNIIMQPEPK